MKKLICFLSLLFGYSVGYGQSVASTYAFTNTTGTYAAIAGTSVHAAGVDDAISSAITIPFTFQFACTNFTQVKISSNGWLTFNTATTASNAFNDLEGTNYNTIAPLWDDHAVGSAGVVRYTTTGTTPNRIFKVEWSQMEWTYSATSPAISFQAWLYEGSNLIEFIYKQESAAITSGSASIGLKGSTATDFISINGVTGTATASTTTETATISTKPATGTLFRFTPSTCSGAPTAGTASASLTSVCSGASTVLSLSGTSSGCGLTYQWQSSSNNSTWSNISGATSSTYTASPTANTYYRCVVTCGASSSNSASVQVTVSSPVNDNCAGAIALTVGSTCSYTAGNVACASQTLAGCVGTANDDVWYSFVANGSSEIITLEAPSGFDPVVQVFSGSCGGTSVVCNDGNFSSGSTGSLTVTGLTAGNTYWIRVYEYYSSVPTTTTFNICVSDPPSCPAGLGTVVNVASLPYSSSGRTTCGKGNEITSGNAGTCGSSSYFNGEDEVFVFTPTTSGQVTITQSNTTGTVGVMLYAGCPFSTACIAQSQSSTSPKSLCVNVTAGTTYYLIADSWPSPSCYTYDISITAPSTGTTTCNLNYTSASIAKSTTNAEYTGGTSVTLTDDYFANAYSPIGFSFCFDGVTYTQCLISSNGYIIFDKIGCVTNLPSYTQAAPSGYSPYSFDVSLPDATESPRNAVLLTWQDINPNIGGTIKYQTTGTAPNRIFIASFNDVPYYSCTTLKFKGMIKLYETSNIIELHIDNKEVCSTWNDGNAVLGLQNFDGTIAKIPANRNGLDADWTTTNEAWRFTPSCATCSSPLPVTFVEFSGSSKGSYNEINWSTASETNNSHFILEHSSDGVNFIEIGRIEGNGNSNEVRTYSFNDKKPFKDVTYYRLIQYDFDGKGSMTEMISVRTIAKRSFDLLDVYPVPSGDLITVSLNTFEAGKADIRIMELTGREMKSEVAEFEKGNTNIRLSINELPAGVYLVKVSYNGGDTQLRKIVKK